MDRAKVTHVAIRYNGKIYSLPAPNRHNDVRTLIRKETGEDFFHVNPDDEGFLDESGAYLRRKVALASAIVNDQILPGRNPIQAGPFSGLTSEDVW